jgi:hypothetical protein
MAKQPGLDGRHRDRDGETHAKRDDTLVRAPENIRRRVSDRIPRRRLR